MHFCVTYQIDDDQRVVPVLLAPLRAVLRFVEQESGDVGCENRRVHDEYQDDPVPDRLERRVVQYRPAMDAGRLQLVLGKDVRPQGQDLEKETARNAQ